MNLKYLADTSALVRIFDDPKRWSRWSDYLGRELVGVCPLTEYEILYTAKSVAHRQEIVTRLNLLLVPVAFNDAIFRRGWEIQEQLALRGQNRSAGAVGLAVAATAEDRGLTVLHYDRDFDTIAGITGQPTAWLAPSGTA